MLNNNAVTDYVRPIRLGVFPHMALRRAAPSMRNK